MGITEERPWNPSSVWQWEWSPGEGSGTEVSGMQVKERRVLRELSKVLSLRVLICLECLLFQGRLEIEDPKLSADTTNGQIDE